MGCSGSKPRGDVPEPDELPNMKGLETGFDLDFPERPLGKGDFGAIMDTAAVNKVFLAAQSLETGDTVAVKRTRRNTLTPREYEVLRMACSRRTPPAITTIVAAAATTTPPRYHRSSSSRSTSCVSARIQTS